MAEKIKTMQADKHPIGSIYLSIDATNPAVYFGGTWERLKDRFLLAAGDTYPAGSKGGEAEHVLTEAEMPSHRHTYNKYLVANDADGGYWTHNNQFSVAVRRSVGSTTVVPPNDAVGTYGSVCTEENLEQPMNTAGGGQPHNNLPPYLAVYMWVRIA